MSNRRKFFFLRKFSISKRKKFVAAVILLSFGLFISQHFLGRSGIFVALFLSILTISLLFVSNHKDIKENFSVFFFVLPFFYSLAFALFYFLVPARFLTRMLMTSLYAVGLYSLFLSMNIFTVASMRTIGLLSSARTVSFIMTLITYFFLSNVVFSLSLPAISTALLVFIYSFFLIAQSLWTYTLEKSFSAQSLWTYTLEKSFSAQSLWACAVSFCLFEATLILWFWPSSPTFIALFLTGVFYTMVGLSHVWFDKRLFRNVLWEYGWVAVIVSSIFFLFTSWRG